MTVSRSIHSAAHLQHYFVYQMLINKRMNEQIVAHPYYEIALSSKRECSIDICYSIDESQKYCKLKKLDKVRMV